MLGSDRTASIGAGHDGNGRGRRADLSCHQPDLRPSEMIRACQFAAIGFILIWLGVIALLGILMDIIDAVLSVQMIGN